MVINEILENEELSKNLNDAMGKTFYRYKIFIIMNLDEFKQECYLFLMKKLKYFDSEKSKIKSYISTLVMTCASECIKQANGQSTEYNKKEIKEQSISMDKPFGSDNEQAFSNYILDMNSDFQDKSLEKIFVEEILNFEGLTDLQRQVLKLTYEGYTQDKIALMLKTTQTNISTHFKRAKRKIVINFSA
jgi:RNA polymerase sigma factor (sigma-70 family)